MRVSKYLFVLSIVLVLFASLAVADSTISVTPQKNQITPHEDAVYEVTVENNENVTRKYSIHSFVKGWAVSTSPVKDKIFELGPSQSHATSIIARPVEDFPSGLYYLSFTIQNDQGEEFHETVKVYLRPEEALNYLPSVTMEVDVDEKITPGDPLSVKVFLENKNPLNLSDIVVKIQSDIPEFVKHATISLPPLDKKTVEFSVLPSEYQQPKEYTLFFVIEHKGQVARIVEKKIEVVPLVPSFEKEVVGKTILLKTFNALEVRNAGNVKNTQVVMQPLSFWQRWFAGGDGGDIVREEGQYYITWEATLSPDEQTTFYYVVNYRILLYVLVILILFGAFYLYATSPVYVGKSAVTVKKNDEGALSEIKITLEVKNKTKKPIKDVKITDLVPAIANVTKSLELGTLRPETVKHTREGTKVVWGLAELDGHEHRLITYKIKATLNILGTFSLPRAQVEFKKGKGKKRKAYSNVFRIEA